MRSPRRAARTMNSVSQNQPGSWMASITGRSLSRRKNLYPVSVSRSPIRQQPAHQRTSSRGS